MKQLIINPSNEPYYSKDFIKGFECGTQRQLEADRSDVDRPQGEWVAVSCFEAFGGDEDAWIAHGNPIAFHYCSECKEQTRIDEFGEEILSNYCPNCGARMKGADDEAD